MQDQLKTVTDETLHYRYNPQADVLAVRLAPDFGPATETPVDGIPGVSLSQDGEGKTLGFRIEGVQSMLLRGLVRGIFDELRPQLEAAGAVEAPPALDAPGAATPSPGQVAVISRPADAFEADEDSDKKKKKKRKRRRRRKKREMQAEAAADVESSEASAARADSDPASKSEPQSVSPAAESEETSDATPSESESSDSAGFVATEPPKADAASDGGSDLDSTTPGGLRVGFGAREATGTAAAAPRAEQPKSRRTKPEPKPEAGDSVGSSDVAQPDASAEAGASASTDSGTEVARKSESSANATLEADTGTEAGTDAKAETAVEPEAPAPPAPDQKRDGLLTGWGQRPAPQRFLRKLAPGGAKDEASSDTDAANGGGQPSTDESAASADDAPGSPAEAGADSRRGADAVSAEAEAAVPNRDDPNADRAATGSEALASSSETDDAGEPDEAAPAMSVTRTAGGLATGWSRSEPEEDEATPAEPIDESELAESFDELGLHPTLLESIGDMGFSVPTPIQAAAIPAAMKGRDVVGLAQTGTGKTLAFVAPGLHRMLEDSDKRHRARVLVLAPTRELTVQVAQEAERIAARSDLRVATIYGGVAMGPQIDALKRGTDLIVATPGRMLDHLRRGNASMGEVKTLVLDEADRMLDMGFLPDVRTIMRFLPEDRQTLLFTATMPPEIESLSLEFQNDPETVEIARRKPPASIDQRLYPVGKHLKVPLLVHLLQNEPEIDRVLIFTERKIDADNLGSRLKQEGIDCALMHGDRRQSDREKALRRLRDRQVRVLVATNVAARGLDIEGISHVINFDIPQTVDEYVHRIGRTARADATGKAYSLVTMGDEIMVTRIESALERELPRHQAEGFDYDVPAPSWAKPSPKDVIAMLGKEQSRSDRLRGLGRRR